MMIWILIPAATIFLLMWIIRRCKKYPIAPGLPPLNLFVVPRLLLHPALVRVGNAFLARMPLPSPPQDLTRCQMEIPGPEGTRLPLTLYAPSNQPGPLPCLVYLHGGGFCFADAWYIHRNVMVYARRASCRVVFVHYRTAEKQPFPAAFEDTCCAVQYIWDHAKEMNVDRRNLAIGGDSAGGALAAACALWVRDHTAIRLRFQLLIYPVTDSRMKTESMDRGGDTPCWNATLNKKMWQFYLRAGDGGHPAWAAPMLARDFSGLPPAYIETEQFDCLHDEGAAYAEALRRAGVPVQWEDVPRTFHGFDLFYKAGIVQTMLARRSQALDHAWKK